MRSVWTLSLTFVVFVFVAGCTTTPAGDDACQVAEAHVVDCLGQAPSGLFDACEPEQAAELVALDCASLEQAVDSNSADGFVFGLTENQACVFNMQCGSGLVCRPAPNPERWTETEDCADFLCITNQRCRPLGQSRQLCDGNGDCAAGLSCVGQQAWDNGRCLMPAGPTEQHHACGAFLGQITDCGLDIPPGLEDDCLSAGSYDGVVEALDMQCDRLEAVIESGLDLGDGFLFLALGADRACAFNFQCGGDLVCRPATSNWAEPEDCAGFFCTGNQFCVDLGGSGDLCDSDSDCRDELICTGEAAWFNGRCGFPQEY